MFSRDLVDFKPRTVEVLLIPEGVERLNGSIEHFHPSTDRYHALSAVTKPIGMLRGLDDFKLREAKMEELPTPWEDRYNPGAALTWGVLAQHRTGVKKLSAQLRQLVMGDSQVYLFVLSVKLQT